MGGRRRMKNRSRSDKDGQQDDVLSAYNSSLLPYGLSPLPGTKYIYSGAEGLPTLTDHLHTLLTAKSTVFAKQISESAFAYYAAVLTWKRMLEVHQANGFLVLEAESAFVDQVDCLKLRPPKPLQIYLNCIGNCTVPQGREYQFRVFEHSYHVIGAWKGLFGVANHEKQHLYRAYPCLDIYGMRIQADLKDDANKVWKLPDGVADPESLNPTVNLLGWKPATKLSDGRRSFLEQVGIATDSFKSENETLLFNPELLVAIQNVLDYPRTIELNEVNKTGDGSLAQIPFMKCVGDNRKELANEMTQYSYTKIVPNISQLGAAFSFRIERKCTDAKSQNWCIHEFKDDNVPTKYNDVCNILRAAEPPILQYTEFSAVDCGFVAGLSRWIESFVI